MIPIIITIVEVVMIKVIMLVTGKVMEVAVIKSLIKLRSLSMKKCGVSRAG